MWRVALVTSFMATLWVVLPLCKFAITLSFLCLLLHCRLENKLKDEMVKEAFNEVSSAHNITVRIDPKASSYWSIKFENGNLVVIGKAYASIFVLFLSLATFPFHLLAVFFDTTQMLTK